MKKNKVATPTPRAWSKTARIACSLLLVVHLLAVFAAPFSGPPPASTLARGLGNFFSPYLRSLYLYHGYRFFAPDPGPSHLVRYEVDTKTDGTITGKFPDLEEQWPRLLYHRYFMLSETLYQLESSQPPREIFEQQQSLLQREIDRWRQERHYDLAKRFEREKRENVLEYQRVEQQRDLLKKSIATEIGRAYDSDRVRLYLVEHTIPLQHDIEEALQERSVSQEDSPILLADPSRFNERMIYPRLETSQYETVEPPPLTGLNLGPPVSDTKRAGQ